MLDANELIVRLQARVTLILRKRESVDCLRLVTSLQTELQAIIEQATCELAAIS